MMQRVYSVVFKKSALKELKALSSKLQNTILEAIQLLALNPFTEVLQTKKLKGADSLYRFRVQDYRVIYSVENKVLKIAVIMIGHRREVYR